MKKAAGQRTRNCSNFAKTGALSRFGGKIARSYYSKIYIAGLISHPNAIRDQYDVLLMGQRYITLRYRSLVDASSAFCGVPPRDG